MQHKIVNMLDPQSHHNPKPKRSSSSGTLNIEGLVQDCSSSVALATELLQSCTKPSIWSHHETFSLWNSLCQWAVPMAVLWIGSLPQNSLNYPNLQTDWSHLRMPMMYIKSSMWSGFEIKNWIDDQFQSSPQLVGIWTVLRCIFVPNLEIVVSYGMHKIG